MCATNHCCPQPLVHAHEHTYSTVCMPAIAALRPGLSADMCAHADAQMHLFTSTHVHMHTCTHTHAHACTYIHTHAHIRMHTRTLAHIHTHMHTYACTHACRHAHLRRGAGAGASSSGSGGGGALRAGSGAFLGAWSMLGRGDSRALHVHVCAVCVCTRARGAHARRGLPSRHTVPHTHANHRHTVPHTHANQWIGPKDLSTYSCCFTAHSAGSCGCLTQAPPPPTAQGGARHLRAPQTLAGAHAPPTATLTPTGTTMPRERQRRSAAAPVDQLHSHVSAGHVQCLHPPHTPPCPGAEDLRQALWQEPQGPLGRQLLPHFHCMDRWMELHTGEGCTAMKRGALGMRRSPNTEQVVWASAAQPRQWETMSGATMARAGWQPRWAAERPPATKPLVEPGGARN